LLENSRSAFQTRRDELERQRTNRLELLQGQVEREARSLEMAKNDHQSAIARLERESVELENQRSIARRLSNELRKTNRSKIQDLIGIASAERHSAALEALSRNHRNELARLEDELGGNHAAALERLASSHREELSAMEVRLQEAVAARTKHEGAISKYEEASKTLSLGDRDRGIFFSGSLSSLERANQIEQRMKILEGERDQLFEKLAAARVELVECGDREAAQIRANRQLQRILKSVSQETTGSPSIIDDVDKSATVPPFSSQYEDVADDTTDSWIGLQTSRKENDAWRRKCSLLEARIRKLENLVPGHAGATMIGFEGGTPKASLTSSFSNAQRVLTFTEDAQRVAKEATSAIRGSIDELPNERNTPQKPLQLLEMEKLNLETEYEGWHLESDLLASELRAMDMTSAEAVRAGLSGNEVAKLIDADTRADVESKLRALQAAKERLKLKGEQLDSCLASLGAADLNASKKSEKSPDTVPAAIVASAVEMRQGLSKSRENDSRESGKGSILSDAGPAQSNVDKEVTLSAASETWNQSQIAARHRLDEWMAERTQAHARVRKHAVWLRQIHSTLENAVHDLESSVERD
jgi:hypothetical protein